MSTHKWIDRICVIVMALAIVVTVLFMNGESLGLQILKDADAEGTEENADFTENDLACDWEAAEITAISLEGDTGTVEGSGAYFVNGDLYITAAGYYDLSGELTDGSVVVETENKCKVFIRLNGVSITNSEDACINVQNAEKVFLTLAEGTENVLECGNAFCSDAQADNRGGAIFAHDDLTINGEGKLSVRAPYKHGIDANDMLVITGGNITIDSAEDGIHVNDEFRICNAVLTINAGDDGIHCDNEILIAGGTINIEKCYEGIEGLQITMKDGDVTIYPTDDGVNANGETDGFGFGSMTGKGGNASDGEADEMQMPDTSEMPDMGETPELSELPDMGNAPDMSNAQETEGDADVKENPENEQTSDDTADEDIDEAETFIRISGGKLTIINEEGRDADGLDSNGDIYIEGGEVYISMTGTGANAAIDYGSESGGVCKVSGGTLVACGGSSMLEEIDASSDQPSFTYIGDETTADTEIALCDSDGNEMLSYQLPCECNTVTISLDTLEAGQTYTLRIGEEEKEITLTDTVTTVKSGKFSGGDSSNGDRMPGGMTRPGDEDSTKDRSSGRKGMSPGGAFSEEDSEKSMPTGGETT